MPVNTDIWGNESSWTNYFYNNCKAIDYPAWNKVLSLDWELNKLLDNSISYCGTIEDERNFYLNKMIAFTSDGPVRMYSDSELTNTVFCISTDGRSGNDSDWKYAPDNDLNRWSKYDNPTDMFEWGLGRTFRVLFKFKLNKLLWVPYVVCQADQGINTSTYTYRLDNYVANYKTQYPYITRVYCVIHYNSGTDSNPAWSEASESANHLIWAQPNLYFSEDVDPNKEYSNYCVLTNPDYNHKSDIPILGMTKYASRDISGTEYRPIALDPDTSHYIFDDVNNPTKVKYIRRFDDNLLQEIYHQISFYGVFFLGGEGYVYDPGLLSVTLTDSRVYVGVIDENGYAHGNYTHGEDNANAPQFSWEDTDDSNYDPSKQPPMPDNWSNYPNAPYGISSRTLLNHWYTTTDSNLKQVMNVINDVDLEVFDKNLTFGLNPIDGILQLRRVFMSSYEMARALDPHPQESIKIGELDLSFGAGNTWLNQVQSNSITTITCCSNYPISEPRDYKDFRAYKPYSVAYFYDAFCGVVEVDPAKILGKYITIKQTVDFLYGDKITSLYAADDKGAEPVRIATLQGNCSEEIPINGNATADYMRNKFMLRSQLFSEILGGIGTAAMGAGGATISATHGNVMGAGAQAIGTAARTGQAAVNAATTFVTYSRTMPSVVKVSNGTTNVESGVVNGPTLFISIPKMDEGYSKSDYKNLTGFSGYKVSPLKDLEEDSVHIVSHPRINISGTSTEAFMICDQLQKGIYIKKKND